VTVIADSGKQGCQTVPNLAIYGKKLLFSNVQTFLAIFNVKFLPFFEIPISSIGKESMLDYLSN